MEITGSIEVLLTIYFVFCSMLASGQPTQKDKHEYPDCVHNEVLLQQLLTRMDKYEKEFSGLLQDISAKLDESLALQNSIPVEYRKQYRVKHFQSPAGVHQYTFEEGKARCREENMEIATVTQLQVAWQHGMDVCSCGWLSDGTNRYPVQWPRRGCGQSTAGGVVGPCSITKRDVYCFA